MALLGAQADLNSNTDQATTDELSALARVFAQAAGSIATPAFVYEDAFIRSRCEHLKQIADRAGCKLLYSVKALTLPWVLELIAPYVQGCSKRSRHRSSSAKKALFI